MFAWIEFFHVHGRALNEDYNGYMYRRSDLKKVVKNANKAKREKPIFNSHNTNDEIGSIKMMMLGGDNVAYALIKLNPATTGGKYFINRLKNKQPVGTSLDGLFEERGDGITTPLEVTGKGMEGISLLDTDKQRPDHGTMVLDFSTNQDALMRRVFEKRHETAPHILQKEKPKGMDRDALDYLPKRNLEYLRNLFHPPAEQPNESAENEKQTKENTPSPNEEQSTATATPSSAASMEKEAETNETPRDDNEDADAMDVDTPVVEPTPSPAQTDPEPEMNVEPALSDKVSGNVGNFESSTSTETPGGEAKVPHEPEPSFATSKAADTQVRPEKEQEVSPPPKLMTESQAKVAASPTPTATTSSSGNSDPMELDSQQLLASYERRLQALQRRLDEQEEKEKEKEQERRGTKRDRDFGLPIPSDSAMDVDDYSLTRDDILQGFIQMGEGSEEAKKLRDLYEKATDPEIKQHFKSQLEQKLKEATAKLESYMEVAKDFMKSVDMPDEEQKLVLDGIRSKDPVANEAVRLLVGKATRGDFATSHRMHEARFQRQLQQQQQQQAGGKVGLLSMSPVDRQQQQQQQPHPTLRSMVGTNTLDLVVQEHQKKRARTSGSFGSEHVASSELRSMQQQQQQQQAGSRPLTLEEWEEQFKKALPRVRKTFAGYELDSSIGHDKVADLSPVIPLFHNPRYAPQNNRDERFYADMIAHFHKSQTERLSKGVVPIENGPIFLHQAFRDSFDVNASTLGS
jgi:hypothetical protein